jgi:cell division protein FtsQ
VVRKEMKKRRRRRPKTKPLKRRPKILISLLIFLAGLALGSYFLTLPIWEIKNVVVNGAEMLLDEEVKTLAGVPLSENLFFADLSRAKANLNKITAIKKFRIYRIPPATILISIEERKPIASLVLKNQTYIIDKEGFLVDRNSKVTLNVADMAELPVVAGINEKEHLKAQKVDETAAQIIADIIAKLSPYLESKRMQLELGGLKDVSFLLDDILRVKVGPAFDIERKMEIFEALLPVIDEKWTQVEYVDVRFPDNPVVKYK